MEKNKAVFDSSKNELSHSEILASVYWALFCAYLLFGWGAQRAGRIL